MKTKIWELLPTIATFSGAFDRAIFIHVNLNNCVIYGYDSNAKYLD